jgi:hypothetical protein
MIWINNTYTCTMLIPKRSTKSSGLLIIFFLFSITTFSVSIMSQGIQRTDARSEQLVDSNNNNLMINMQAPDNWNSGIVSQTVAKLNWRLNGLTATNNDLSGFFIVVNLPSLANFALPLGQKTGLLSWIISHYATINNESDVTLADGSSGHLYSISVSTDQLHHLNAPIDKGFDGVMITTKQQGGTYIILYAAQHGRMGEFKDTFTNILHSVSFRKSG